MYKQLIFLLSFILMLVLIATSVVSADEPHLVGWWKFDGNALDSSGNDRNGTLHGNPTFLPGYDGDALQFDGVNDYVRITGYNGVTGTHAFSISAWIKTTDDEGEIVGWGKPSAREQVEFRIDSNRLRCQHGAGNIQSDTNVNDNEWHQVAVTVKENATVSHPDVILWLDGKDDTRPGTDPDAFNITGNYDVKIARRYNASERWLAGLIDDVRIYDRMLSPAEILQLARSPEAGNPSPADGAKHKDISVVLSWSPGKYAALHDVYFGTDSSNLSLMSKNQPLDSNSFGSVAVELGKTYYWRIDDPDSPWQGEVWSFEVEEHLLVDDFESYANSNELWLTWAYSVTNGAGSVVLLEPEFAGNSMKLIYNNSKPPFISEADLIFDTAQDWTGGGIKALELRLHGDPDVHQDNSAEQIYVALEDVKGNSAAVAYSDPTALTEQLWQNWVIDLQDFAGTNSINLASVKKLTIGVGDVSGPGGLGNIYIDDIRLYPSRCLPEYIITDFTGDCVTDYEELDVIMRNWLASDYNIVAEEPDNNRLQAYYKFDETSGTTAYDSSGKGYHATVDPNGANAWDSSGYPDVRRDCLVFDGTFGVSVPSDVFSNISQQVSISVWAHFDEDVNPNSVGRVDFGAGPADANQQWDRLTWIQQRPENYIGQWSHYAFVKDADDGMMRIYHNGLLVAQNTEAFLPMSGAAAGPTRIGTDVDGTSSYYKGKLDEFRIYDYALSHAEVLALALGSGSELYQPLQPVLSPVDPYEDGQINFMDFAALADVWLEKQLWP